MQKEKVKIQTWRPGQWTMDIFVGSKYTYVEQIQIKEIQLKEIQLKGIQLKHKF